MVNGKCTHTQHMYCNNISIEYMEYIENVCSKYHLRDFKLFRGAYRNDEWYAYTKYIFVEFTFEMG